MVFPKKNMVVEIFSVSDKTLKCKKKNFNLAVIGWFFFVVVRRQQKPIKECNLESSFLSNVFFEKDLYRKFSGSAKKKTSPKVSYIVK